MNPPNRTPSHTLLLIRSRPCRLHGARDIQMGPLNLGLVTLQAVDVGLKEQRSSYASSRAATSLSAELSHFVKER